MLVAMQWGTQSAVQPLPEHPAPALPSHTAPPAARIAPLPMGIRLVAHPTLRKHPLNPLRPLPCAAPAHALATGSPGGTAVMLLLPTSPHHLDPGAAPSPGHHQHQQDALVSQPHHKHGSGKPPLPTFSPAENGDTGLVGVPGSESSSSSSTLSKYPMASSSSSMAAWAAGAPRGSG